MMLAHASQVVGDLMARHPFWIAAESTRWRRLVASVARTPATVSAEFTPGALEQTS